MFISAGAIIGLVVISVLLVVIWSAFRAPTDRSIGAIADLYGVPVTAASTSAVRDSMRWTRAFRVGGAVVVSIIAVATGLADGPNLLAIAGGVAAGSLVAELTRPQQFDRTRRQASLDRRGVTDYIERAVLVIVAIAAASLVAAAALAVSIDTPEWSSSMPSDGSIVAFTAAALAVGLAAVLLAQSIARQPAPLGDQTDSAVRHAIRAASISSVLGGALIALGVGLYRIVGQGVLYDTAAGAGARLGNNLLYFAMLGTLAAGVGLSFSSLPRAARSVRQRVRTPLSAS